MSAAILKILKNQASGIKSTPKVIPLSLYPFGALVRTPEFQNSFEFVLNAFKIQVGDPWNFGRILKILEGFSIFSPVGGWSQQRPCSKVGLCVARELE